MEKKNWSYTKKGKKIGIIIGLILGIIGLIGIFLCWITTKNLSDTLSTSKIICPFKVLYSPLFIIGGIIIIPLVVLLDINIDSINFIIFTIISFIILVIISYFIGALVGYIYGKIIQKK